MRTRKIILVPSVLIFFQQYAVAQGIDQDKLIRMRDSLEKSDLVALQQLIVDLEIVCPVSGTRNWTEVRQFNLMLSLIHI